MNRILSNKECETILSDESEWKFYDDDFKYYEKFIKLDWLCSKLENFLWEQNSVLSNEIICSRIINLCEGFKLPTHTFNYLNQKSNYQRSTFTIVTFLNDDFLGGNYYYNNNLIKVPKGFGLIHDRNTSQKIDKIDSGNCFLLFTHFGKIIPNKLF